MTARSLSAWDKYCYIGFSNDRHPAKEDLGSGLLQVYGANARWGSGFLKKRGHWLHLHIVAGSISCTGHRLRAKWLAGEYDRLCQLVDFKRGLCTIIYSYIEQMWIMMETQTVLYTVGHWKMFEYLMREYTVTSLNKAPNGQLWSRHTPDLMQNNNLCTHDIYLGFNTVGANKCLWNVALGSILLLAHNSRHALKL